MPLKVEKKAVTGNHRRPDNKSLKKIYWEFHLHFGSFRYNIPHLAKLIAAFYNIRCLTEVIYPNHDLVEKNKSNYYEKDINFL